MLPAVPSATAPPVAYTTRRDMCMRAFLADYVAQLRAVLDELDADRLQQLADRVREARMAGQTVFIIGNGGSAATASHFCCDLAKGASVEGLPRIRALSLTDNTSMISAVGNDIDYESVFSEQLDVLARPGDVLIAITASGNSPNILKAVELAKQRGVWTVGLIGFGGGKLKALVDLDITVSSRNYGCVEDLHLILDHVLSQYLKQRG